MTDEEYASIIAGYSPNAQKDSLQEKIDKLGQRTAEKIAKLSPTTQSSQDSTITGFYDADSPVWANPGTRKSTARLTGNGYYVNAPELKVDGQLNPSGINARIQADNYAMGVDAPNFPAGQGLEPQFYKQYTDAMNPALVKRQAEGNYVINPLDKQGRYGRELITAQSTEMPMSQTDYLLSKDQGIKKYLSSNYNKNNSTPTKVELDKFIQERDRSDNGGLLNAAKAFAYTLGEGVVNTVDLVPEVAQFVYGNIVGDKAWSDVEGVYGVKDSEAYKTWLGYNEQVLNEVGKETVVAAKNAWEKGDYWELVKTLGKGLTTPELLASSLGYVAGMILPGGIASKVLQVTSKVSKAATAIRAADITGKMTKAQALVKAEESAGAGYKIAKVMTGNVGFVAEAEQFGRDAEELYKETYKEDMSIAQRLLVRPLGLLYAKLDAFTAKAILLGKDPIAKAVPDMLKALPESLKVNMIGKIAVLGGETAVRAAGAFGLEGSTEAIQTAMEKIAGEYKQSEVGVGDVLSKEKYELAGSGLLGGVGGNQMQIAGATPGLLKENVPKVVNAGKTVVERATETPIQKNHREAREYTAPLRAEAVQASMTGNTNDLIDKAEKVHSKMSDLIDSSAPKRVTYSILLKEALNEALKSGNEEVVNNVFKTISELDANKNVDFKAANMVKENSYNDIQDFIKIVNQNGETSDAKMQKLSKDINDKANDSENILTDLQNLQRKIEFRNSKLKSVMGSDQFNEATNSTNDVQKMIKDYLVNKDLTAVNKEFAELGFITRSDGEGLVADPNRPGLAVYERELTDQLLNPKENTNLLKSTEGTVVVNLKGLTTFAESRLRKLMPNKTTAKYQTDGLMAKLAKENEQMLDTITNLLDTTKGLKDLDEDTRKSYEAELETAANAAIEASTELERRMKLIGKVKKPKTGVLIFHTDKDGESIQVRNGDKNTKVADIVDGKVVMVGEQTNSEKVVPIPEKTKTIEEVKPVKEPESSKEILEPSNSKEAVKKSFKVQARILTKPEMVETVIDGKVETTKQGEIGDYVLTGPKGEEYTVDPAKVKSRYTEQSNSDGSVTLQTKPVSIKYSVATEDFTFTASWGESMIAEVGDALVYEKGKLSYRIEKEIFKDTYAIQEKKVKEPAKMEVAIDDNGLDARYKDMSEEDIIELTRLETEEKPTDVGVPAEPTKGGPLDEVRTKIESVNKELSVLIDGVDDMNVKKHVKDHYNKKLSELQEDRTRLGTMLDRLETALDNRLDRKYDIKEKSILAGLVSQIDKLVKQMIRQISRLDNLLKGTNKQYHQVKVELQTILDDINAVEAEYISEPVKTTIGTVTKLDEKLYGKPAVEVNGERIVVEKRLTSKGKLEAAGTAINRALEEVKNEKMLELRDELKGMEKGKTSLSAKLIGRLMINFPINSPVHKLIKRVDDSVFGQLTGNLFAKADRLLEVLPKGFKEFFITDAESKQELLDNFKTMATYLDNTKISEIIIGENTLGNHIDNNGLVIRYIQKYVPIVKDIIKGDKLQDINKQTYIVESTEDDKIKVHTTGRNPIKSTKSIDDFTGVLEQQQESVPVDIIELIGSTKDGKLQIDEQTKNILKFYTAKMLADSQIMIGKILSFDESEMAQYLGITDPDEQIRVKQEASLGYVNSASVRKDIGGEVYQALGIRLNETTPEFTEESFKAALGVLVQAIATENGTMDGKPTIAGDKNQNLIKTNWENTGVERDALTKAINKLQYLNENRSRPLPSLKVPKDNANRTVMNTQNVMDNKSVEFLNKQEKIAYTISPRLQRWLEIDETEALKAMGYVEIETAGLHVSEIDAQRARNDKLVREWEILKTFAKATKNKDFYLNWGQTVSGRYTILNDINYQESKLHREFVVAEGSTESIDVNNADSRQMLEASIMQGLDMDPDKLSAETATKNFNKLFKVTDKVIGVTPYKKDKDGNLDKTQVAIKQAYEAMRDGKINAEALAEVFADSEGHHGISSIELLVDWDSAIKSGKKLDTHANLEIDAITSGMILTLLQIGSDAAIRLAEKGGIYTEDRKPELEAYVKKWLGSEVNFTPGALIEAGKKHASEIEEKMKGLKGKKLLELRKELESDEVFKDLYSTIGVAMIGEVQAYKTMLESLEKPSVSEIQQLAMLNQIGELNLKNIRSIAKSPVMVYIYGASTSSIKKKLTYSLGVDTLVKAIKTASKKLKAGENADAEREFISMYIPEEKYVNEFGAKVEKPAERWEQLLSLDIQPAIDTIDEVINATFGTAIETAFESRLGFVDKNRDAAKSIEVLVFEAYQIRLADEVKKFLDSKYGPDRHKGETYRLSKEDMQSINAKLTEDGYGHNIVWDEAEGRINQSLNKTGDKGGIHSTKVTVGETKVGGQIKQFKPAVNTGAAPTISIHAIDGRMMLDVLNRELGGKYAGGNVYDAVVLSLDKAMLTDTADSYNTNMIETGFSRSIVADQLGMLENMLSTMTDDQKKRMFDNIGLRPKGELREDYTKETNRIKLGIGKMLESLETAEEVNKERLINSGNSYYSGHLFQMGSGIAKIEASETRAKEFPAIDTIKKLLQNKLAQDRKVTKKEFGDKVRNPDYVFNLSDLNNDKETKGNQVNSAANIAQITMKKEVTQDKYTGETKTKMKAKVTDKKWESLSSNDTIEIIGGVTHKINDKGEIARSSVQYYEEAIMEGILKSGAKIVTTQDLREFGRKLVDGVWVRVETIKETAKQEEAIILPTDKAKDNLNKQIECKE